MVVSIKLQDKQVVRGYLGQMDMDELLVSMEVHLKLSTNIINMEQQAILNFFSTFVLSQVDCIVR